MMELEDFLRKLRHIEFRTRIKTQEALVGTYHSTFKGRGMTFSECKPYVEGDDVRYIDWNASARQHGIFVKQFVEERELSVCVILDLSPTMRFGSIGGRKSDTAIEAMAILAMSANAYQEDKEMSMEAGMNAHIAKPFDKDETLRLAADFALRYRHP